MRWRSRLFRSACDSSDIPLRGRLHRTPANHLPAGRRKAETFRRSNSACNWTFGWI